MSYQSFSFEIKENVACITLNQPDRGNPFDGNFCREFNQLSIDCDRNPEVRAVLITAAGRFFSVGGDIKTFLGDRDGLPRFIKSATADMHMGVSRFARADAPVVLAADALVTGGAVSMTAGADFVLAGPKAKFYAAFPGIGFSCDCGLSYFLPRRVGSRKASEFLLRNQTWDAETALQNGLVSEVVPAEDLNKAAFDLAKELADGPSYALGEIKRLLLDSYSSSLESQLEMESRALTRCTESDSTWEALNAVAKGEKVIFNKKQES